MPEKPGVRVPVLDGGVNTPQLLSAYAGHWTGEGTGVTVIVPPPGTIGSGEVRGGAPATREFELLSPVRTVAQVDAVVLSGGSAFGLAAGDGVMRSLRSAGRGFPTPFGPVPIVVGMSLFDASVAGSPPSAEAGAEAMAAALSGTPFASGAVGAGAGATTGKWRQRLDPGGVGVAMASAGEASLVAVVAVNAWGDVLDPSGRPMFTDAEAPAPSDPFASPEADLAQPAPSSGGGPAASPGLAGPSSGLSAPSSGLSAPSPGQNTTIGVLLTDALLDKRECFLLAQSGHSGYVRAIHPSHSRYDGDAVVALATGAVPGADLDLLRAVAVTAMADAIRAAVIRA